MSEPAAPDLSGLRDDLARDVLGEAVRAYERAFGDRLVAAYALGSLAHGGFSPLVSDVDLGVVLADPLLPSDGGAIQRLADDLAASSPDAYARLSVFWGTRASLAGTADGGRFPPVDRLDLLHHGQLLSGRDIRHGLSEPSRDELLASGAEFALALLADDATTELLHRPERLLAEGIRRVTKLVLFPVRFVYTAETGLVGTNDAAAAHHVEVGRPGAELVAAARSWRAGEPPQDEAVRLLARELLPLYRSFVDDHRARLGAAGRRELAAAFTEWRSRLDARL